MMITVTSEMITEFQTFVNSGHRGFCKRWKAGEILYIWIKSIRLRDEASQRKFIRNSLEMEGFDFRQCDLITEWLRKEFK